MEPAGSGPNTTVASPLTGAPDLNSLAVAVDALAIIAVTDVRGAISYANDQFCQISGYSQAELIGRNHRILASGYHSPAFFKTLWQTIARGKVWRGEIKNRAKDGSFYWVDAAITPIKDARGKPQGYVTVRFDITKRKFAEARLREQNLQLDTAFNNMARGLSMFDADARLIVCNTLYRKIYRLPEELTKPGTPFATILIYYLAGETDREAAEAAETSRQWIESHLAKLARGETFSRTQHLEDGRTLLVTYQPLPGGGWVDLQEDITEKERFEAKIAHMAHHDALTDLPNRVLLKERLEQALARTRRGEKLAFHLLDLDQFKAVNDTFGHQVGDELLRLLSERLRAVVRESDTIARMGGDEFAAIQLGAGSEDAVTIFAQRLIAAASAPYEIGDNRILVGASIGIALAPTDGDRADQLIKHADLALYRAKEMGRGTCCFFEKGLNERMQMRRMLTSGLSEALAASEMELYYQPIVNLEHYRMTGVEALMRWRHPERGLILPGEFIPAAEESGLIVHLGEWALRQACAQAVAWPDCIKVAVNLSPVQFRQPELVRVVENALSISGLLAARLDLEITESVLFDDNEANLGTLRELLELGVGVVLDDFGTGYSSLKYLQSFPFDKIKIDHSFIKNVTANEDTLKIVRAIAMLARSLGMTTTAEGVETLEQLQAVRFEGCDEVQGFFVSRPLPAADIERCCLSMPDLRLHLQDYNDGQRIAC